MAAWRSDSQPWLCSRGCISLVSPWCPIAIQSHYAKVDTLQRCLIINRVVVCLLGSTLDWQAPPLLCFDDTLDLITLVVKLRHRMSSLEKLRMQ